VNSAEDTRMKPCTTRVVWSDRIATVADLQMALAKVLLVSNQDADVINVESGAFSAITGKLELEEECLSDGSHIWNLWVR